MANDYKAAYERQKVARIRAEQLLEDRSRELYESNQKLRKAYEKVKEQKNTILHQEKLASVGLLGAGVAHEINNPAGFVKSNLGSLSGYLKDLVDYIEKADSLIDHQGSDEMKAQLQRSKADMDLGFLIKDISDLIEESEEGISRISRIVTSLKSFSRPDSEEKENFDLNECVRTTLILVESKTKYKADISTEYTELPDICGMPGSINQVILNMLINAVQAIQDFGRIELKTRREGNFAVLEVSDSGKGISTDNLNHIFDPFFTTKDLDEGTGLGLSVSHGIVKRHGGKIEVESTPGLGTTFQIYLPLGGCNFPD